MTALRWEDTTPIWTGPSYTHRALTYASDVRSGWLSSRLITCVDVLDWDGDGGRDVLLSNWDACYDGGVFLRREIGRNDDGSPRLAHVERISTVTGYTTSVRDGDTFHLISASRLRPALYYYVNQGTPNAPRFSDPFVISLDADWVKGDEVRHVARFADIDGDGQPELLVGTDYWNDYWPRGIEWNEQGYRAYDSAGRWLGGPLRGFLYVFKNEGTLGAPKFGRGKPLMAGGYPLEVYGQLCPTFGDFRGRGVADVVCGEFTDILHFAPNEGRGELGALQLLKTPSQQTLRMQHCIHFPCAVDWYGTGKLDLLIGAEDGYITCARNAGFDASGTPVFDPPVRVETRDPELHASVLPVVAAHDFQGKNTPDLIVGNATGELLYYRNVGVPGRPEFAREVMLTGGDQVVRVEAGPTGSIQGPSELKFGYTCPKVFDWDQDGRADLIASDIFGRHLFYKQRGNSIPPKFDAAQVLTHQGSPLKTVWRVRPTPVDWLEDGRLSYVTLDEQGLLATYWRLTDTDLGEKRILRWSNGEPIRFTEDVGGGLGRMILSVCDWRGNDRLDIIVGTHGRASIPPGPGGLPKHTTHQAAVILFPNVGSNAEPVFGSPRTIKYRGEPIAMGMHTCAPEPYDVRGLGALDLIVGIEDGSIVWLPREELTW